MASGGESFEQPPRNWPTVMDVALAANVTPSCVCRYIKKGKLKARWGRNPKGWRIDPQSMVTFPGDLRKGVRNG